MILEIKNFDDPDEKRELDDGLFELISAGGLTVGRATYPPGWRWSEKVGSKSGQRSCQQEHVVLVVSGRALLTMDDGTEVEVAAGDLCAVPPGHDFHVIGDEPYISLHFQGAEHYGAEAAS